MKPVGAMEPYAEVSGCDLMEQGLGMGERCKQGIIIKGNIMHPMFTVPELDFICHPDRVPQVLRSAQIMGGTVGAAVRTSSGSSDAYITQIRDKVKTGVGHHIQIVHVRDIHRGMTQKFL